MSKKSILNEEGMLEIRKKRKDWRMNKIKERHTEGVMYEDKEKESLKAIRKYGRRSESRLQLATSAQLISQPQTHLNPHSYIKYNHCPVENDASLA
jgi:hypothetical protein